MELDVWKCEYHAPRNKAPREQKITCSWEKKILIKPYEAALETSSLPDLATWNGAE